MEPCNIYGATPGYFFSVPVTSICCEVHEGRYLIFEFLITLIQALRLSFGK